MQLTTKNESKANNSTLILPAAQQTSAREAAIPLHVGNPCSDEEYHRESIVKVISPTDFNKLDEVIFDFDTDSVFARFYPVRNSVFISSHFQKMRNITRTLCFFNGPDGLIDFIPSDIVSYLFYAVKKRFGNVRIHSSLKTLSNSSIETLSENSGFFSSSAIIDRSARSSNSSESITLASAPISLTKSIKNRICEGLSGLINTASIQCKLLNVNTYSSEDSTAAMSSSVIYAISTRLSKYSESIALAFAPTLSAKSRKNCNSALSRAFTTTASISNNFPQMYEISKGKIESMPLNMKKNLADINIIRTFAGELNVKSPIRVLKTAAFFISAHLNSISCCLHSSSRCMALLDSSSSWNNSFFNFKKTLLVRK